jgi:isocitrate dehydrogenase
MAKRQITVAHGDGIGPEIMAATLHLLERAGADIEYETIQVGEQVYLAGYKAGIEPSAWESIFRTKTLLKAPITTPQGGGFRSLNVTIRTQLGLYANVRPCVSYYPIVKTKHPKMDVVIIRENEEDLYSGIEYHQTPDTYQSIKIITRPGTERICRYAFEYARQNGRKKVTCFTKDNIMKWSDGAFHKIFEEIAHEYPDIENEHWIVDIGAAKLADTPENFDVLVLPNLYGDILSDVAAQIAGSVGLAGSANIGERGAMFEAIHGSAPRRAGQNLANPSGLMLAAVLMLVHIDQPDVATRMHNAWLRTLEEGIHTYDIYDERVSQKKVGTKEFAKAVADRLGQVPETFQAVHYSSKPPQAATSKKARSAARAEKKELVGVDIYVQSHDRIETLQPMMSKAATGRLKLKMITNRGARLWPEGSTEAFCVDQWRCRFLPENEQAATTHQEVLDLLKAVAAAGFDFIKIENLYTFDGEPAYS